MRRTTATFDNDGAHGASIRCGCSETLHKTDACGITRVSMKNDWREVFDSAS
jgi:hypothetical protein